MSNINLSIESCSTRLISLDKYLMEMIDIYNLKKFPKVLLLNGKKGIGKFTLVIHFLNYIFTKHKENTYDLDAKKINTESIFYKQLVNQASLDVLLITAEEKKNIKIEDIRNLKSILSRSSLSNNPRFIIIDEVEFINENSINALLKSLEEPAENNFFILINNQHAELIKTISSRCFINNIFLKAEEIDKINNYLLESNGIENLLDFKNGLTPGLFIRFNEAYLKYNIDKDEDILIKIDKLLKSYKKNHDKILVNLTLFLVDQYFYKLSQLHDKKLDSLQKKKSSIIKNINEFIYYNLNINSVLNSIKVDLQNVLR